MAIPSDISVGFAAESTFKTFVTPTRWVEPVDETLDWTKGHKQGQGLRVGARIPRAGRRVVPTAQGKGDLTVEVAAKGLGTLFQWALGGTSTSTVVSGSTYQQNHAIGNLSSMTLQKGIPEVGGTVDAYSFLGCVVDSLDIDSVNGDIVTAKLGLDIADVSTAQSLTAPSYVASTVNLFHFGAATMAIGGTITDASTTALPSSAAPITTGVRSFSLSMKNNIQADRFNYGGSGRKSLQVDKLRSITGKFVAEYDQTTLRDAFLGDTSSSLLLTFTGGSLSSGSETFAISLPCVRLDGQLPNGKKGELVTIEHSFTVLDNLSNAPMQVCFRTSDSAL